MVFPSRQVREGRNCLCGIWGARPSQQIKVGVQDLLEEPGAVAAEIEDHRDPSPARQGADPAEDARQHLDQVGVGLAVMTKSGSLARSLTQ